ncbi:uncharacterized protein LOC143956949 isoform X2 [Lithobates pipiens]
MKRSNKEPAEDPPREEYLSSLFSEYQEKDGATKSLPKILQGGAVQAQRTPATNKPVQGIGRKAADIGNGEEASAEPIQQTLPCSC